MKKNLKNAIRHIMVEYYSFRSADNKQRYQMALRPSSPAYRQTDNSLAMIGKILKHLSGKDPYKLRIRYKYIHAKTGRTLKTKQSPYFYVAGKIADKAEVSEYFSFAPEVQKEIGSYKGDSVFWVHYQIEPLSEKND